MKIFVNYLGSDAPENVGVLVDEPKTGRIFFQYSPEWARGQRELSPLHLPNRLTGANSHNNPAFFGLFGLFYDSLPDRWGMTLAQSRFESIGRKWTTVTPLELLSYRGSRSMGALAYEPDTGQDGVRDILDVRRLADESRKILEGSFVSVLPELENVGGSAGGMRPKAVIGLHETDEETVLSGLNDLPPGYHHWLLKFDTEPEKEYGRVEMAYSLMARASGIDIPKTRLLTTKDAKGRIQAHFAIKRFDRDSRGRRVHVQTFGGLAHRDFNLLDVDYSELLALAGSLGRDLRNVRQMFRRAVFNIFVGNGDDHAKNHAFLMLDSGEWNLAPAYDLTWSQPQLGRRSSSVMGNKAFFPGEEGLLELAEEHGIHDAERILDQVKAVIGEWPYYAQEAGLSPQATERFEKRLGGIQEQSVRRKL